MKQLTKETTPCHFMRLVSAINLLRITLPLWQGQHTLGIYCHKGHDWDQWNWGQKWMCTDRGAERNSLHPRLKRGENSLMSFYEADSLNTGNKILSVTGVLRGSFHSSLNACGNCLSTHSSEILGSPCSILTRCGLCKALRWTGDPDIHTTPTQFPWRCSHRWVLLTLAHWVWITENF